MALTKADKEFLTSSIKLSMQEELEPLRQITQKHEHALFGPEGNNGINSQVKYLTRTVSSLKRVSAIGGAILTAALSLKDYILGGK